MPKRMERMTAAIVDCGRGGRRSMKPTLWNRIRLGWHGLVRFHRLTTEATLTHFLGANDAIWIRCYDCSYGWNQQQGAA